MQVAPTPQDRLPISERWRTVAAAGAVGGLGAGGVAVFRTHLEAGPVALLAVGVLFGIIAMTGAVPWKINIGNNSIEMLHRLTEENKGLQEDKAALQSLSVELSANVPADREPQVDKIVARAERTVPEVIEAIRDAVGYQEKVEDLLRESARGAGGEYVGGVHLDAPAVSLESRRADSFFDGMLIDNAADIRCLVEIRAHPADPSMFNDRRYNQLLRHARERFMAQYVLVVTRVHLSDRMLNALIDSDNIVVAVYGGEQDRARLVEAVQAILTAKLGHEKRPAE